MLPEDQKRILGYFIEEAKDHLNTIEQGLLNLAATVDDPEMMNEVFRAAHSVKGGAAMLGLASIQRTSHRMEDFFKIMKESTMQPDRDLESTLLQIFDGLQEQLEQLQSPFGLTDDQAKDIMAQLEPVFVQAESRLDALVSQTPAASAPSSPDPRRAAIAAATHPESSALQLVFRSDVPALLRDMLATFKRPDNATSRQELERLCQRLHSIGEQFELSRWCDLAEVVSRAIASPHQTYRTLAPVVIKDLKQAQDLVLAGANGQVTPSAALQALLPAEVVEVGPGLLGDDAHLEALLTAALDDPLAEPNLADLFAAADAGEASDVDLVHTDNWLDPFAIADNDGDNITDTGLESVFGQLDEPLSAEPALPPGSRGGVGPAVGTAELNSLADLFENDSAGLAGIWEEEDLPEVSLANLGLDEEDISSDLEAEFTDLLDANVTANVTTSEGTNQALDDMASLFGYDLDAGPPPEAAPASAATPSSLVAEDRPTTADPLADVLAAESASAAPAAIVDPLDDFLADSVAPAARAEATAAPLDDFFELDRPVDSLNVSAAAGDELDRFFEPIEDDDAHTMPELNLDLDSEVVTEDASDLNHGLFPDPSPAWPAAAHDGTDISLFLGESDYLDDDPFGALELGESVFDQPLDDALLSPEPDLIQGDTSFSPPAADHGIMAPATDPLPWDTGVTEATDFTDLEILMAGSATDGPESLTVDSLDSDLAVSLGEDDGVAEITHESLNSEVDWGDPIGLVTLEPELQDDNVVDDGFDDLDALLGEDLLDDAPPEGGITGADYASAMMADRSLDSGDDEFGDLEKLLEEADQLGGTAPSLGGRRSTAPAARRSPRRASTGTDQTMRVSVNHLDTLSNLVGELVVNRNSLEQDQERLRQFLDNLLHQVSQLNDVGQRMRDLYERSLLESSLIANRQAFALRGSDRVSSGSSSHVTGATFDALEMDRFTGFHTLSQEMIELIVRVREASSDIEFTIDSTDQIARQFRQVTTQLQEGLNKARMVPFGQTADRLPRAVRDISIHCGNEANLVVEGRDTLIDKMILECLYDPMTHLVNNAITHGIESPEERQANGKPREGTITVRAFYQGNQTVIYIADNGGGINPAVVKAKALKKGLITPAEAQAMTEIEVYDLLFVPGFSTRDQADNFSGRGVGMDVVRTALADIRGSITIESEVGKGTSFTIRLPLTLSITKALSCVNNQARIAFPMDGVEDMFDVPRERIQTDDQGHSCILWRDTLLPFRPLGELLRFNRSLGRGRVYGGPQDEDMLSIVVLRSTSTFIALQVDQVIGEQEIVIKQLEGPVPKPMGIAGATVLGDGRVMPIADVLELIDLASGRMRRDSSTSLWAQNVEDKPVEVLPQNDPTVLIVDDSITVRELLSMSFNKMGYRVEQARDGQEAWEKLRSGLPCDLVFCDIEMPRMDGLELLSRIQKDSTLSQIPIAMLTSRGADRHRQMAVDLGAKGYFTKPYLEEMLLDAAQRMLKGENMIPKITRKKAE